jgi:hypothetical protein
MFSVSCNAGPTASKRATKKPPGDDNLTKSFFYEGSARSGFQVPLERDGLDFIGKYQISDQPPWLKLFSVVRLPGVMGGNTLTQVCCKANIDFVGKIDALKEINVSH